MRQRNEARSAERLAGFALLACGVLAIVNLPHGDLPLGWLLAWTMPAALFGMMRQRTHRPWIRAVAASVTQVVAFAVALRYVGSLSRPAILACTILPPLAFVAVRRREADAALGLFLSFCVLLVGVILGGIKVPILAAYGVCACLALRSETHLAVLAVSRDNRWRPARARAAGPVLVTALLVAIPCLFAAFAFDRTLAWIPSPLRGNDSDHSAETNASSGPRRAGLDDSFDLGGGGILADMAGEQLVLAKMDDGTAMPNDLYLRSGFFAKAHLDRWEPGRLRPVGDPAHFDHVLRRPLRGAPVRTLEIERFAGARNFVFVPPTATSLRGLPQLQIDPEQMWLRQLPNSEQTDYAVSYQDLQGPGSRDLLDRGAIQLGLLDMPAGFGDADRERYMQLLDRWGVSGTAWEIASRIADGLAAHCRYDRVEPTGPYRQALDNFLFNEGDRRGYCMYFASAAALMLRLKGVPCRIGVGLYGGDPDRAERAARIYGSQHAHAWVEIPYSGRGYVVFDPTPPDERGQRMPSRMDEGKGEDPELAAAATNGAGFWWGLVDFLTQPWLLISVLVLAIAAMMWPGGKTAEPRIVLPRSIQTARRLLVRILRTLSEAGHLRSRGQTLEQFSAILRSRDRLEPAVNAAFVAYQEVRFGGRQYDVSRETVLLAGLEAATQAEPWVPGEPQS